MDGSTLANYVVELGLKGVVMSLPDLSACSAKPTDAGTNPEVAIVPTDFGDEE
jgi:hypothetical protein